MPKFCSFAAPVLTNLAQVSFLAMSEDEVFAEVIVALKETFSDDRDPTPEELQGVTGMELHECKAVLKAYLDATAGTESKQRKKKPRNSQTAQPTEPPADPSLAETMPMETQEELEQENSTPTSEPAPVKLPPRRMPRKKSQSAALKMSDANCLSKVLRRLLLKRPPSLDLCLRIMQFLFQFLPVVIFII